MVKFYDTRGLSDSDADFEHMMGEWSRLSREELQRVHFVIFVLPPDRLSHNLMGEMNKMVEFLTNHGMRQANVLVLLNKCDFFKEVVINQYEEQLRHLNLPPLLKNATILRTCFLNASLVEDTVAPLVRQKMTISANLVVDYLLDTPVEPFQPRAVIMNKETRELIEEQKKLKAMAENFEAAKKKACVIS